ncbi:MAG TPA: PadR family transcriptional regulator [Vicinamibacterales bacterium]|nr:PadR family transcriptional regulator [Vicinamibacterales bacterium]
MRHEGLRELEHLVLLAMSRLEPPIHAVPIINELNRTVGRAISRASVYVVLRRLEVRGLVSSLLGDPTPQRGGRAKRLYALTPRAVRALKAARRDFVRLWDGSRVLGSLLLAAAICVGGVRAQSPPPTLSGTWLNLDDRNAVDVKTAAALPNALLTIVHDSDRFALTRSWSNGPIKESHVCDGRENANGYSIVVERTRCRWDAAARSLVIEGTIGREDGTVTGTMKYRYALDDEGRLVVERTRIVHALAEVANAPRSYTQRYRRVAESEKGTR